MFALEIILTIFNVAVPMVFVVVVPVYINH